MDKLINWVTENVFHKDRLATILVVVGILMFMGVLPSSLATAIQEVANDQKNVYRTLRQICVNTSRDQASVNHCYGIQPEK